MTVNWLTKYVGYSRPLLMINQLCCPLNWIYLGISGQGVLWSSVTEDPPLRSNCFMPCQIKTHGQLVFESASLIPLHRRGVRRWWEVHVSLYCAKFLLEFIDEPDHLDLCLAVKLQTELCGSSPPPFLSSLPVEKKHFHFWETYEHLFAEMFWELPSQSPEFLTTLTVFIAYTTQWDSCRSTGLTFFNIFIL